MALLDLLPVWIVGFVVSIGLTPVTRQVARRVGFVDKPSSRKIHAAPMPLLGGLAIYGAFVVALLLFRNWPQHIIELGAILAGCTGLALVGMVDDRIGLSPWTKFPAQFIAAGIVMAVGIRIELTYIPVIDIALTILWIVGLVNAINFMDNMDGLAAGVSAIIAGFIFVLAASQGQELVSTVAAALCGSAIGFLIYNFNPATTFMGDTGSLVLGFLLAVLGIKLRFAEQPKEIAWMIPILVLAMPIFDTTLVFFTRIREGRSPVQGGKDHTSHRLMLLGLNQRQTVIALYIVTFLFGLAATAISRISDSAAFVIGGSVALLTLMAFVSLELVRWRDLKRKTQQ
jgi:UDP-GlcNAc:undecaprenyl-phosphate/decaprenyl-phosphate GlcNAc-1-phosphate transferase